MRALAPAAVIAIGIFAVHPSAAAVVDPDMRVVVRTYDTSATRGDLTHGLGVAAAILQKAGIGVTWVTCEPAANLRGDPCLVPLAVNQLAIRFVHLPPGQAPTDIVTLGDSLVDTRLRAGSLATIYLDRVSALAARCDVDVNVLLGRAIAHEIGHLLLGTSAHAVSGLMRSAWSFDAIRHDRPAAWAFTSRDARDMRNAVRVRQSRLRAAAKLGE